MVQAWIGAMPDSAIPPRVKVRIFEKFNGICPKCTRKLVPKYWECDHIISLINGGRHAEDNLQPLCTSPCHSQKTKEDVAEKAKVYRKVAKAIGVRVRQSRPIMGSRESGYKKHFNGTVTKR